MKVSTVKFWNNKGMKNQLIPSIQHSSHPSPVALKQYLLYLVYLSGHWLFETLYMGLEKQSYALPGLYGMSTLFYNWTHEWATHS